MRFYHFYSFLLFLSVSSGYVTSFSVSEEDIDSANWKTTNIEGQFALLGLFVKPLQVLNLSTKNWQTAEKRYWSERIIRRFIWIVRKTLSRHQI